MPSTRVRRTMSPGRWLAVSLITCLIALLGASLVQTSAGAVQVRKVHWVAPTGKALDALLLTPSGIKPTDKAPAIVTTHGWYNNKEMQDMNYVEFSRRGYVVLALDMYSHGNSDAIGANDVQTRATGMTDAVEYVASLPYVDRTRIGVTGHSNGARASNWAVDDDNAKAEHLIKSVLLVANDATYRDAKSGAWINKYGNRDVGIVAARYDEFFFRSRSPEGKVLSAPRDYLAQPQAQSFLKFGTDPTAGDPRVAGELYRQNIQGRDAIRAIFTPDQIHPWNTISATVERDTLRFFEASLGAPRPIDPGQQVWQWKAVFNTLGLVGFALLVYHLAVALAGTKPFGAVNAPAVGALPAPTGRARHWFWISLVLGQVFGVVTYPALFMFAVMNRPPFMVQSPLWYIGLWAVAVGAFTGLLMWLGWRFFGGRESGISLSQRGLAWRSRQISASIVLALTVTVAAFAVVFVGDWWGAVDFRNWVLPVKAFGPDKLPLIALILPFLLAFYVVNSVAINSFNWVEGKRPWANLALLAFVNVAGVLFMIVLQYVTFFVSGSSFSESVMKPPVSNIIGIWLFPMVVYFPLAAVLDRLLYKRTGNPYLGGIIMAFVVAVISATNTITQF